MQRVEAEAIYERGREVVVAVLLRMDEQFQRLTVRVAQQEERIGELERRLARNSRDSSSPPSQDPPGAAPRRGTGRSGRAQGGQPGHEGHGRPLLPAWAVDEVVEHWPARCACGHVFYEAERVAVGEPACHQVEELPVPVLATCVSEHRCQRVRCPRCGARQAGSLPAGVAASAFGPSSRYFISHIGPFARHRTRTVPVAPASRRRPATRCRCSSGTVCARKSSFGRPEQSTSLQEAWCRGRIQRAVESAPWIRRCSRTALPRWT